MSTSSKNYDLSVGMITRKLEVQCKTQGCNLVFGPHYTPKTQSDQEFFKAQNKFVYGVLESKPILDIRKDLVCEHKDMNAQVRLAELKDKCKNSTTDRLSADDLLTYVSSEKFEKGLWQGTSEQFVLHWMNQVRIYNNISTEKITPKLVMTMLQNAVQEIRELASVKTTCDSLQTHTGKPTDYHGYVFLLMSALASYDARHSSKRKMGLNVHNVFDPESYYMGEKDVGYDRVSYPPEGYESFVPPEDLLEA